MEKLKKMVSVFVKYVLSRKTKIIFLILLSTIIWQSFNISNELSIIKKEMSSLNVEVSRTKYIVDSIDSNISHVENDINWIKNDTDDIRDIKNIVESIEFDMRWLR